MSEQIILTIPRDRTKPVQIEVAGVVGSSCEDKTRALEAALGGQVVERNYKPEYHEQPVDADTEQGLA